MMRESVPQSAVLLASILSSAFSGVGPACGQDAPTQTVTRGLAELAIRTKTDDITLAAYEAAKRAVIDALVAEAR